MLSRVLATLTINFSLDIALLLILYYLIITCQNSNIVLAVACKLFYEIWETNKSCKTYVNYKTCKNCKNMNKEREEERHILL